jgi:ribosomal protein S18 acetylase RimI-like enzyme
MPAFTVRPATSADISALARLIVELYHAELPGLLSGSQRGQEQLLAYTLRANGEVALNNRLVVCDEQQHVVGTGMVQFPTEPAYERAPQGTIAVALRELGLVPTLKLAMAVVRTLFGMYRHTNPHSALIHSVVVSAAVRGNGAGQQLMSALEAQIQARGLERSRLQVLQHNTAAQRFYQRLGYREIWRLDGWRSRLSWSSLVMEKVLTG